MDRFCPSARTQVVEPPASWCVVQSSKLCGCKRLLFIFIDCSVLSVSIGSDQACGWHCLFLSVLNRGGTIPTRYAAWFSYSFLSEQKHGTDYGHSWSLKEMSEEKMHVYVNISSQNKIGDVLFPALNRRDSFPRFPLGHACKVEHHPLSSSIPSITSQCLFLQGRVSLPPSVQLALSRSVSAPMPLTLVLRPLLPRKVWIISPRP